ncbi:MAG: chemotaxis protein CheW [Gemmatimonadales bacterium]
MPADTSARNALLGFADAVEDRPAEAGSAPGPELHLLTFGLGREEFGIPVTQVREVIRVADITRVPHAPAHVRGVANLRGRILAVVDLRSRLGLPEVEPTPRSRIVVVDLRGRVLGLLVDAVSQVTKVPEASVVPAPEDVRTIEADYLTGVARWQSRLIILLDLEKALTPTE